MINYRRFMMPCKRTLVKLVTSINSVLLLLSLVWMSAAFAQDIYHFNTQQQRTLFNELIEELRCPKCQNQNLMDSNAEISIYMKEKIHQMVLDGKNEAQIVEHLKQRYGDFISYEPPLNIQTAVLWFLPVLLVLFSILLFMRLVKISGRATTPNHDTNHVLQDEQLSDHVSQAFDLWVEDIADSADESNESKQ